MIGERALQAAQMIYGHWEAERERTPIDRVVAAEFRSRHYLNSGERRWVSEVIYGCVRYRRRQQWLLDRLGLPATAENSVRLWVDAQALPTEPGQDTGVAFRVPPIAEPAALAAAFAALPGPEHPLDHIQITLSFPNEMANALFALLGEEAVPEAQALNTQAPTTLRVNPLRVSRAHLQRSIPDSKPTRYSPWGLALPRRVNIHDLHGYRTGWFEVQEEASQLAAMLLDPLPDQRVVEVGAGAGGKTLVLAAMMQNRGYLLALDTNATRLEELNRRAERAGVTCVETVHTNADMTGTWQPSSAARRTINRMWGRADCVLVDAPCTGSGVLRRSPDVKWRDLDLAVMLQLQRTLLAQAALMVTPGGHLIYVTCAFEREQNEAIIEMFLEEEQGRQFVVEAIRQRLMAACERAAGLALLPPSLRSKRARRAAIGQGGERNSDAVANGPAVTVDASTAKTNLAELIDGPYLRTWPHRHGLDAFFVACLRRNRS